ncbi:DNA-3-methyladenine glycosylase I [Celeribacter neptunius]|uniref:DNA-3-methyladenine glycosylase I n=1 Tax=Celeribacter neptunius TaxID=588602 RepID=A0A1I3IWY4_9RHOB|nr:DNA-3-methyladenine glycosylase I [Celeribacter neptunius]SFI52457.1 DNA-3-methyladenine glycosylase I [Celeribacter neptunius]
MRSYQEILDIAAARKGGVAAVLDHVRVPKTPEALAAIPGDRWLAEMARHIFQTGMSWKVVEAKWPGIEAAFEGFDVTRIAHMSEDWFDALLKDTRIIRSGAKLRAIQENAEFIARVDAEEGGFARKIAQWPAEDYFGLLDWLKDNGARLGGNTGAYTLRMMGRDGFMLSKDVVARLIAEGIIDKAPTSKPAKRAVQEAFNSWRAESGETFNTISSVLAQSIDG